MLVWSVNRRHRILVVVQSEKVGEAIKGWPAAFVAKFDRLGKVVLGKTVAERSGVESSVGKVEQLHGDEMSHETRQKGVCGASLGCQLFDCESIFSWELG